MKCEDQTPHQVHLAPKGGILQCLASFSLKGVKALPGSLRDCETLTLFPCVMQKRLLRPHIPRHKTPLIAIGQALLLSDDVLPLMFVDKTIEGRQVRKALMH
jgi:hypothetical protein